MIDFKGSQFERDIILWGVRWYVAYPISYRQLEEMMAERGVEVDHSSLNRWVLKYTPLLEVAFRQRKRPVAISWRLDETYVRVKGQWKYLYRAVDKAGRTVDFLLTAKRDRKAAGRFLRKAIDQCGTPEKITINVYLQIIYDGNYGISAGGAPRHNIKTGAQVPVGILAEVDRKIDDGSPYAGGFQLSAFPGNAPLAPTEGATAPPACTSTLTSTAIWNATNDSTNCGGASLL